MTKRKHKTTVKKVAKVKTLKHNFLLSLAFIEGALVIFCEMLGAKLLGSFFGNSLAVWTAIISVTITFLALGYFVGGVLSKSERVLSKLALVFSLAALFMATMPSLSVSLFLKFGDSSLIFGAITSAILLIGLPIFFLGSSSPIIIQLLNKNVRNAGSSAGQTYAISTLAGILTTLFIGFFVLPNWGIKLPIVISGTALIALALYIRFSYINLVLSFISLAFVLQSLTSENEGNKFLVEHHRSEGLMGQLKVVDQRFPGSDLSYRLLMINGIPQTIIINNSSSTSFWKYPHIISMAASINAPQGQKKSALLLGMGGGVIAKELLTQRYQLDIVDIDKRMYDISKKHFFFKPTQTTRFKEDEARHYIKTCKKKYDLVVLDIASGEIQPNNVFTLKGLRELKQILTPNGMILVQYQEKITPNKISGSQSIARTFRQNGFKVYQHVEKAEISSVILCCSMKNIDFNQIKKSNLTANVMKQDWVDEALVNLFEPAVIHKNTSIVLNDDKPMLQLISAETIRAWRKSMIKNYGIKLLKQ